LALQLSRLGVRVALWDVDAANCQAVKREIEAEGGLAWDFAVDVSDRKAVAEAAEETRRVTMEPVAILVNNAGIMPAKPCLDFSPEEIERLFAVNVFSQYWTLREFLPDMLAANNGHVLSMCSIAGLTGAAFLAPYSSTKFAVKGLMETLGLDLRQEYPSTRVRLTTVHPFAVNTGLAMEARTRFPRLIPILEPRETASAALLAMRRGQEEVFVPGRLWVVARLGKIFPRRLQMAVMDFLDVGVGRSDGGGRT